VEWLTGLLAAVGGVVGWNVVLLILARILKPEHTEKLFYGFGASLTVLANTRFGGVAEKIETFVQERILNPAHAGFNRGLDSDDQK